MADTHTIIANLMVSKSIVSWGQTILPIAKKIMASMRTKTVVVRLMRIESKVRTMK